MHGGVRPRKVLVLQGNTTRTIDLPPPIVTGEAVATDRRGGGCSFVVIEDWHYGAGDPFCGAPAEPRSPYCALHRALCVVPLETPAARAAKRALRAAARAETPPPAALAFLAPWAVPDPGIAPEETRAVMASLDLTPPSRHDD